MTKITQSISHKKNFSTPPLAATPKKQTLPLNSDLHAAVRRSNLEKIGDILKENPNFDLAQKDEDELTVWDHAHLSGNPETLNLLLKFQFGSLWAKIIALFQSVLSRLQISGIDHLNQESKKDYAKTLKTDLQKAAFQGDLEALKNLVNQKNINKQTTAEGHTLLHLAALAGKKEAVEFLLERGARKDLLTHDRKSALHMAAIGNHQEIAEILIRNGINIDEQDLNGSTPLHFAMLKEDMRTTQVLIQHGANLELQNKYTLDPLTTFAGVMQNRCKNHRSEIELAPEELCLFTTIALSGACRLAGFSNLENAVQWISRGAQFLIGYNNAKAVGKTAFGKTVGKVLYVAVAALPLAALGFLYLNGTGIPIQTARMIATAGTAAHFIRCQWNGLSSLRKVVEGEFRDERKHFRHELYRPTRNLLVRLVNSAGIIGQAVGDMDKLYERFLSYFRPNSQGKPFSLEDLVQWRGAEEICSEFNSKDECLASELLKPTYESHAQWILGLDSPDCSAATRVMRKEGLRIHPDKCPDAMKETCSAIFRAVSESRKTLCRIPTDESDLEVNVWT